MAIFSGPNIVADNLQIYMDWSNQKCYNGVGSNFNNIADPSKNLGHIKNNVNFLINNLGILKTNGANNGLVNDVGDRIDINTSAANIDRFSKESNFSVFFMNKWISGGGKIFATGSAGAGTGQSDNCIWQMWCTNNTFFWWNSGGGGANNISNSGFSRTANVWEYFGFTYEHNPSGNNIVRIYINGNLISTTSVSNSTHDAISRTGQTNLQWTLGGGYNSSCRNSNSVNEFANFMLYNKTLSQTEIKQNFEALRGRFGI